MRITVLSIWHARSHFIPTTLWWRYYYPYFAHDKIEAQPCYIICLKTCEGARTQASASLTPKPGTHCLLCLHPRERGDSPVAVTCQSDATCKPEFRGAKMSVSFKNKTPVQIQTLMHSYGPRNLGDWGLWVTWVHKFKLAWTSIVRPCLKNKWI